METAISMIERCFGTKVRKSPALRSVLEVFGSPQRPTYFSFPTAIGMTYTTKGFQAVYSRDGERERTPWFGFEIDLEIAP